MRGSKLRLVGTVSTPSVIKPNVAKRPDENSPALQRRVSRSAMTSPEGTAERCRGGVGSVVPPGLFAMMTPNPALKRRAIVGCPSGTQPSRAPGRDGFHAVPDQTLGRTDHREGVLANADASEWPVSPWGNSTPQGLISDRVEPVPTVRNRSSGALENRLSWFDKEAAPAGLRPGASASDSRGTKEDFTSTSRHKLHSILTCKRTSTSVFVCRFWPQ